MDIHLHGPDTPQNIAYCGKRGGNYTLNPARSNCVDCRLRSCSKCGVCREEKQVIQILKFQINGSKGRQTFVDAPACQDCVDNSTQIDPIKVFNLTHF